MENNQFDNEIKKMLEGLEVPFQDAHWDSMSKRLQETQEPNTADAVTEFDKTISAKITGFEVPFSESSWMALRSRLVASAYLKKWIFQTKAIEGLLMLVFALFLMDSIGDQPKKVPVFHGPIAEVHTIQKADKIKTSQETSVVTTTDQPVELRRLATNVMHTQNGNSPTINTLNNSLMMLIVPATQNELPVIVSRSVESPVVISEVERYTSNLNLQLLANPLSPIDAPNLLDGALPKIVLHQASKINFGLSVYGIANADHIITGVDPASKINVPNVWSPGYGGGVAFSKRKGKLDVSVGLEYQEVKYFPTPIVTITQGRADLGYAGAGTTTVELAKVSLPVTLGYPLINTRKHQLSVEIGLLPALGKETFEQSTYIVGNYNKENEGILYKKMADIGAQPTVYVQPSTSQYTEPRKESSRVSRKPKFFASARANISYEFKLDRRHSIFAKASYSHQLTKNGIGLPNDYLNTVGLHFGSRVYL